MKVEGIEIEWWDKEKFKGRTIEICTPDTPKTTIDIPDNDILCDACNSEITEFPVAVWHGMAYCKECFEKYLKSNAKE
jgi:formylmethanofuran dehydrogenase subunit E